MKTGTAPHLRYLFPLTLLPLAAQCGGDADETPVPKASASPVTRTFPNPPLPQSVGFRSVKITTYPADPQSFALNREIVGPQGEELAGLGDAAFYNGLDMLYVRVGSRGFSVRLYTDAQAEADRARVRDVMMTLGRVGASNLR